MNIYARHKSRIYYVSWLAALYIQDRECNRVSTLLQHQEIGVELAEGRVKDAAQRLMDSVNHHVAKNEIRKELEHAAMFQMENVVNMAVVGFGYQPSFRFQDAFELRIHFGMKLMQFLNRLRSKVQLEILSASFTVSPFHCVSIREWRVVDYRVRSFIPKWQSRCVSNPSLIHQVETFKPSFIASHDIVI